MAKTHLSYMYTNSFGGATTTTLCGRMAGDDDINCSDDKLKVDCKICQAAIDNTKNWRWKKYLKNAIH